MDADDISRKRQLEPSSVLNAGSATIYFSQTYNTKKLKLIEVSADIVKAIESGSVLRLVGDSTAEDAVLCTGDRTYSIKRVETSNSVCIAPPVFDGRYIIEALKNEFFEVKQTAPRPESLREILKPSEYRGLREEDSIPASALKTRADLENCIQASPKELSAALDTLGAIVHNGFVRLMSRESLFESLQQLLGLLIEKSLPLERVPLEECIAEIPDSDPVLMLQAAKSLGQSSDGALWAFDETKVAAATAHILFRQLVNKRTVGKAEFMAEWEAFTPGRGARNESALEGVAISDGALNFIYFPKEEVLSDPAARFKQLFDVKPKWTLSEFRPYVSDLFGYDGAPKTIEELLLTYTRCVDSQYMLK